MSIKTLVAVLIVISFILCPLWFPTVRSKVRAASTLLRKSWTGALFNLFNSRRASYNERYQTYLNSDRMAGRAISLPEALFAHYPFEEEGSNCHLAREAFAELCSLKTSKERTILASLVTNCHLESSGRPVFHWKPKTRLKGASEEYISQVFHFLPMMEGICEKAGHNPWFLYSNSQSESIGRLFHLVEQIGKATKRLEKRPKPKPVPTLEHCQSNAVDFEKLMLNVFHTTKFDVLQHADEPRNIIRMLEDKSKDSNMGLAAISDSIEVLDEKSKDSDKELAEIARSVAGLRQDLEKLGIDKMQLKRNSDIIAKFIDWSEHLVSNVSKVEGCSASDEEDSRERTRGFYAGKMIRRFLSVGHWTDIVLAPLRLSSRIETLDTCKVLNSDAREFMQTISLCLTVCSLLLVAAVIGLCTRAVSVCRPLYGWLQRLLPSSRLMPSWLLRSPLWGKTETTVTDKRVMDEQQVPPMALTAQTAPMSVVIENAMKNVETIEEESTEIDDEHDEVSARMLAMDSKVGQLTSLVTELLSRQDNITTSTTQNAEVPPMVNGSDEEEAEPVRPRTTITESSAKRPTRRKRKGAVKAIQAETTEMSEVTNFSARRSTRNR